MALIYNITKNVFAVIPAIVPYAVYVRYNRAVFSEFQEKRRKKFASALTKLV